MNFFTQFLSLQLWQIALLFLPALLNMWGIWHAFNHSFANSLERIVWICACVFIPLIGGIAYLLFGCRRALKNQP